MKYIIVLLIISFSFTVSAQIILEHSYPNAGTAGANNAIQQLYIVNLESAGAKYLYANKAGKKLKFYNLDHTPWKTIDYSQAIDLNSDFNSQAILYVSQHLFDLDDEIEFLYVDRSATSIQEFVTQVINEDGSIIFTAEGQAPTVVVTAPQFQVPIQNTPEGAKLILSDDGTGNGEAHVYALPGTLAVSIQDQINALSFNSSSLSVYPNPSRSEFSFEYSVPFGTFASIRLTDELGRLVQTLQLPSNTGTYNLQVTELGAGIYFCTLLNGTEVLATQKLVVSSKE